MQAALLGCLRQLGAAIVLWAAAAIISAGGAGIGGKTSQTEMAEESGWHWAQAVLFAIIGLEFLKATVELWTKKPTKAAKAETAYVAGRGGPYVGADVRGSGSFGVRLQYTYRRNAAKP